MLRLPRNRRRPLRRRAPPTPQTALPKRSSTVGKPPMPQNGTWWLWNADTGEYYDTHISCELPGPIGIGIDDIQLTSGDHSPGTTDIYTILLTDGSLLYHLSLQRSEWYGRW